MHHVPLRSMVALLLLVGCDEAPPPMTLDASVDAGPTAVLDAGPPPPPTFEPASHTLSAEVEITRDSLGVVHVYAQDDLDLFYASGYAQATDRLFSMDLARRRALGRRAEVLGADFVDDDQLARAVEIERWARHSAARLRDERPDDFALVVAWTAGINRRVEEVLSGDAPLPRGFGPDELDYAPEPWDVADGFAVGRLVLFGNANQIEFDLLATILRDFVPEAFERVPLMQPLTDSYVLPPSERPAAGSMTSSPAAPRRDAPALPADAARRLREGLFEIVDAPTARFASNNWAVDGEHTANGRPLVAGDPHQGLTSPMLFFMQHLDSASAGGSFDAVGFSFIGTPGVQLGHNADLAWTATTTYPDISDLWEVRVTDTSVFVGEEEVELTVHQETIAVRDAEPITIQVERVPGHGVLLPEGISPIPITRPGRRLLYGWVGFRPTLEAASFFDIGRASTLDELDAAVDTMELGCFNFIAASRDGITYRSSMRVPDRGPGALSRRHWTMLDGDDRDTFWGDAILPLASLPHSRGAGRGWLASANNDPYGFTEDGTTLGDAFYFGVFYDPGTRGARIDAELERLVARGDVTPEDMMALQRDSHSVLADLVLPVFDEAWAAVPTDEALAEFRDRPELTTLADQLAGWDRRLARESSAAVVFDVMLFFATSIALADDFGVAFDAIVGEEPIYMVKWAVLALTEAFEGADAVMQEGRDVILLRALAATATWLEATHGGVDPSLYSWAEHHGTRFRAEHPEGADGGWHPTDGGLGTVDKSPASFLTGGGGTVERLESTSGPVYRMVAGFGDDGRPQARVTVSRGNAGEPDSPWYANAMEDWIEGRYVPLRFDRADVDADAVETTTLTP